MSIEPAVAWNFACTPDWIDPRASFSRASIGRTHNRIGTLVAVPANAPRPRFHLVTGVSEGLLIEPQRTKLLL